MAKKEVQQIVKYLNECDYEDITIALMFVEKLDGKLPILNEDYNKFKRVYDYYAFDNRNDNIPGILNNVLQNPDEVYEQLAHELGLERKEI